MPMFPPNHPERLALAEEVHARPPEPVATPARASYVAVKIDADDRAREQAHLAGLCQRHGVIPPAADATPVLAAARPGVVLVNGPLAARSRPARGPRAKKSRPVRPGLVHFRSSR